MSDIVAPVLASALLGTLLVTVAVHANRVKEGDISVVNPDEVLRDFIDTSQSRGVSVDPLGKIILKVLIDNREKSPHEIIRLILYSYGGTTKKPEIPAILDSMDTLLKRKDVLEGTKYHAVKEHIIAKVKEIVIYLQGGETDITPDMKTPTPEELYDRIFENLKQSQNIKFKEDIIRLAIETYFKYPDTKIENIYEVFQKFLREIKRTNQKDQLIADLENIIQRKDFLYSKEYPTSTHCVIKIIKTLYDDIKKQIIPLSKKDDKSSAQNSNNPPPATSKNTQKVAAAPATPPPATTNQAPNPAAQGTPAAQVDPILNNILLQLLSLRNQGNSS